MIRITDGKGFRIKFSNGWSVSVQFGPGNYCDHYGYNYMQFNGVEDFININAKCGAEGSSTAECAVFNPEGNFVTLPNGNEVTSRSTPDEILELMNWAAKQ